MANYSCCVPKCSNYALKTPDKSFHSFPKNEKKQKEWIFMIRRDIGPAFRVKRHTKVCCDHFEAQDFRKHLFSKKRFLKEEAVPSIFAWNIEIPSPIKNRQKRLQNRRTVKELSTSNLPQPDLQENETTMPRKGGGRCCSVPQCCNTALKDGKSKGLSFHLYPTDESQLDKWMMILGNIIKPSKWSQVCSEHFRKEDFMASKSGKRRKCFLKENAIPSQKLPLSKFEKDVKTGKSIRTYSGYKRKTQFKPKKSTMNQRFAKIYGKQLLNGKTAIIKAKYFRNKPKKITTKSKITGASETANKPLDYESYLKQLEDYLAITKLGNICDDKQNELKLLKELAMFVDSNRKLLLTTDERVTAVTGLPCLALYQALVDQVAMLENVQPIIYRNASVRDRVLLVLIKLKHNLSYECLSVLFTLSNMTVSKIFKSTLKLLAIVLKTCLFCPSLEVSRQNVPTCFNDFENTRVVLGCIEILFENSLWCPDTRIENVDADTVKFVVGVTPAGWICYASRGYGGSSSDELITLDGSVLSLCLPMEEAVMVDKGFLIESECEKLGLTLYVREKIRVEYAINSINHFGILTSKLDMNLLAFVDDIMIVCAGIVNLSSTILQRLELQTLN